MKKLITILLCLILTFGALSLTACGKKEYTMEDVIKASRNEIEFPLSVLTGTELSSEYSAFSLHTKKAIRITSFSYTDDLNRVRNQVNSSSLAELCKEYQAGEKIDSWTFMVYNLVIEFEVIE